MVNKVFAIALLIFSLKLVSSCIWNAGSYEIDIAYNKLVVEGVDNSDWMMQYNINGKLYSEAVALKLALQDTNRNYYCSSETTLQNLIAGLAFTQAFADQPVEIFKPVNNVEEINIYTLYDMKPYFNAGEEISDSVMCPAGYGFNLYEPLNKVVSKINQTNPECSFTCVLKNKINNTEARFKVDVVLSDGSTLSDTTEIFTILEY